PNIVQIYMVGEEGDLPFFSMEYVNGKTLQSVIETEGFLTARRAVPILRQAAEALAAAHEAGIVHRDIKPSNILLDSAGRVKVTDFGIAQVATESRLTQTGMLLGTPGYFSPEQCLGEPLDARTDIYARRDDVRDAGRSHAVPSGHARGAGAEDHRPGSAAARGREPDGASRSRGDRRADDAARSSAA